MDESRNVAVVTGASRGIGRVLTERLSSRGVRVIAAGRSREQLDEVSTQTGAFPLVVDVSDASEVHEAWERITADFGVPDLVVNNAGVAGSSDHTWEQEPADWWRVFEVNVLGTFLMSRAALPGMIRAGGGRIVNLSSNAAFYPIEAEDEWAINSAYMASKAAVIRFTEALAREAATHGVKVFSISPGMVKTDMTQRIFAQYWDDPETWTPPELTADLVEFIATGALDNLSGRYIHASADDWRMLTHQAAEVLSHDWYAMRIRAPLSEP